MLIHLLNNSIFDFISIILCDLFKIYEKLNQTLNDECNVNQFRYTQYQV